MKKEIEKERLIKEIATLIFYLEIDEANVFKIKALKTGINSLENSDFSLDEICSKIIKIKGIGEGIINLIEEFRKNQSIAELVNYKKKYGDTIFDLLQIPGLGPKKIRVLFDCLGVSSLGELEYACKENRLISLKGFGEKTQTQIVKQLVRLKQQTGYFRIDKALNCDQQLIAIFKKYNIDLIPIGQLARRTLLLNKLEYLVTNSTENIISLMGEIYSFVNCENDSVSFTFEEGIRVEIKTNISEQDLNKKILSHICEPEILSIVEQNEEKFKTWSHSWLETVWIKEHKRAPSKNSYRTSQHGTVKGVFHCHTNASDGNASLEQMVEAAENLNFEYIGISDHSQSAFYANGLDLEKLKIQKQQITELQKKKSIKIFFGIESDILQDGSLDYPDEVLVDFDFIIASVHSRFKMDHEHMTQRLLKALSHPLTTFWGHPTGRLLLDREPYQFDVEKVFECLKQKNVIIEMNANPCRLDIDWGYGHKIEEKNIKISVNPDAHSVQGLNDTKYGMILLEKAMLPIEQVFNLASVNEVEEYLWNRKKRFQKK